MSANPLATLFCQMYSDTGRAMMPLQRIGIGAEHLNPRQSPAAFWREAVALVDGLGLMPRLVEFALADKSVAAFHAPLRKAWAEHEAAAKDPHAWQTASPFPWTDDDARRFHAALAAAFPFGRDAARICKEIGIRLEHINFDGEAFYVWKDVLDLAAGAQLTREVVAAVLSRGGAGFDAWRDEPSSATAILDLAERAEGKPREPLTITEALANMRDALDNNMVPKAREALSDIEDAVRRLQAKPDPTAAIVRFLRAEEERFDRGSEDAKIGVEGRERCRNKASALRTAAAYIERGDHLTTPAES